MAVRPVSVTVPVDPASLRVIRAVAGGAGAAAGLTYDRIDDLRLGIDEAAGLLLREPGGSRLDCVMSHERGRVEVRLGVDGAHDDSWPPPGWDSSLAARVLDAITDGVVFEQTPARRSVRFVV